MKIKVSFDPGEVDISFIHRWRPATTIGKVDAGTEAVIQWGERIYYGKARLNPKDMPSRAIGRKHALRRALFQAGFKREERTEIWAGLKERGMRLE